VADSTNSPKSLPALLQELRELIVAYFKQETVEPLKDLGRFLAYGVAGSAVIGLGVSLLLLGGLRLLQTETGDAFEGNWSWVPYLTVLAAAGVVIALALAGRARSTKGARH
jgi:hypothetical protein